MATSGICAVLLAIEAVGVLALWAPVPLGWMWVGGRVYRATGSLFADFSVALLGFAVTTPLVMSAMARLDRAWISLRRRAGREQATGALEQVVVAAATLGLGAFLLWYYVLDRAFIMPFMPSQ